MEKIPNIRESGISRIVGFDNKTEEEVLDFFKKKFENNSKSEIEETHSVELNNIIKRINEEMVGFLEFYGIQALNIPMENIHIIDKTKLNKEILQKINDNYKNAEGLNFLNEQSIILFKNYIKDNKLSFIASMVHEMLHLNSFNSYQKSLSNDSDLNLTKDNNPDVNINIRRSGFGIGTLDGKKLLFDDVNECVITELQIRFERRFLKNWPELQEEINEREKLINFIARKNNLNTDEIGERVGSGRLEKTPYGLVPHYSSYSYENIRKRFNVSLDDIYRKNKNEFSSREEVFNLFAKSTLTGRLMSVARLIEKTYGEGTFRKLGEISSRK